MPVPYLSYFNLKEEPFTTTANPRFFYQSPIHSMALGKAEFTVDAKKGLTIVFGDTGYGKSTLARLLHGKFKEKGYISVLLTNPNYPTTNSLLRTIIQEFQLPKSSKAFKENLDIFKHYLFEQAVEQGKTIVLIIDEAQTLRIPLLELLRQIINYETNDMKLLQLVLFSQQQFPVKNLRQMCETTRTWQRCSCYYERGQGSSVDASPKDKREHPNAQNRLFSMCDGSPGIAGFYRISRQERVPVPFPV
jgi:type II secretory pathway predicted ATPase ExeA